MNNDASVNMNIDSYKRKADQPLSPLSSDPQRRYQWDDDNLLSQNRFFPLQDEGQVSDATQHSLPSTSNLPGHIPQPAVPKIKVPPIFLPSSNYREVTADLKKIVKNDFTTSSTQNKLKINLTTIEDYRLATKFYTENHVNFFTYQDPTTRPLSAVIKNVPPSLSTEDIKEELEANNFPILKITRLLHKNRKPTLVVAVELNNNENGKKIFQLNQICNALVRVEPRKTNESIPQCFRCQRYGHTRNYCQMEFRCVKCLGNHYYKECTKTPDIPPTCVNCNENHPANYKGCKHYINQIKTRNHPYKTNTRYIEPSQPTTQPNNNNNPHVTPTRSYASVTRNDNAPATHEINPISPVTEQIINFLLKIITPHLETIKNFFITHILPNFFNGTK